MGLAEDVKGNASSAVLPVFVDPAGSDSEDGELVGRGPSVECKTDMGVETLFRVLESLPRYNNCTSDKTNNSPQLFW